MHHGTEATGARTREEVLEHVTCAVCGGKDYDVVLEAQCTHHRRIHAAAVKALILRALTRIGTLELA